MPSRSKSPGPKSSNKARRSPTPTPKKDKTPKASPVKKVKKSPTKEKTEKRASRSRTPKKKEIKKEETQAEQKKSSWDGSAMVDQGFFYKIGLRSALGPIFLMSVTPVIPTMFLLTCQNHKGSFFAFLRAFFKDPTASFINEIPIPTAFALKVLAIYFSWQWAFLMFLPGKMYTGPKTESNQMPVYRDNAVLAFILTHVILIFMLYSKIISGSAIFEAFPAMVSIMTPGAFLFCVMLYIKGSFFSNDPDNLITESFIWDFYWGVEIHPRILGVNVKQWMNCRVAMMGWASLLIIYCAAQFETTGHIHNSLLISVLLQLIYIFKFFVWEVGYMHSIDIILDRAGYYIIWGVLAWLPTVYTIHSYYIAMFSGELSTPIAIAIFVFGLLSIAINYQADLQRQRARETNGKCDVWWGVPATVMPAKYTTKDGKEHDTILLTNGWWGVARHFNYIPELCLALSWGLPAWRLEVLPFFYFVYLCILLIDRASRDDKRCAQKYGKYWEEYKKLCPYSMIPGLF